MFVSVIFLLVIGLVVYLVVRASRSDDDRTAGRSDAATAPPMTGDVTADLERWRAAGLLDDAQVTAILEHERLHRPLPPPTPAAPPPTAPAPTIARRPRRELPDVTEALGYLGGILAIVGMSLLVGRYWTDIPIAGRLALSGGLAVVLFGVGLIVPEDREPALRRTRWFLWTVSSAATAVFGAVLAHELSDGDDVLVAFAAALAVVAHDAALWWRHDRPLQQLTFLGATAVAVGTGVAELSSSGPAGLAVWVTGAVGVALGFRHLTPLPKLTLTIGAATAVLGAMVSVETWQAASLLLATSTALALLALAEIRSLPTDRIEQLLLAAIGGVSLLANAPATIGYFAERSGLATGLVVWGIGAALVVVGGRDWLRVPIAATLLGGAALVGGAALTAIDLERVGPLFGIATALGLIVLGTALDRFALSIIGSVGLLINVPWAIVRWFPGEGRAPLLIMVSGALIIVIAVFLSRAHDQLPHLGGGHHRPPRAIS
jgi:hypothetical protein